jgi:hypothetical protein
MWTGRLPFGKCDIVPGEFFVATEFQHIAWLPIIPIQSWVIVEGSIVSYDDYVDSFKLTWEGVPIRFSVKSFLLAWVRTCLLIFAIAAGFYLLFILLFWLRGNRPLMETGVGLGVTAVSLIMYRISFELVDANPQRAEYLRGLIARKYGQP